MPRKSLNFQFQSSPLSCLRWSAPTRGEACKKEAEHSAEQQHKLRRSVKRRNAHINIIFDPMEHVLLNALGFDLYVPQDQYAACVAELRGVVSSCVEINQ